MHEVGSRELKAAFAHYLRRVARGERLRITVRGRHVADLVPPGSSAREDHALDALIADGRITPATRPRGRAPALAQVGASASAHVLGERDAER